MNIYVFHHIVVNKSSKVSVNNLFEIGMNVLICLASAEKWVMAYQLLEKVKMIAPKVPNADFVLISSEIYLVNRSPVKALYLLQGEMMAFV